MSPEPWFSIDASAHLRKLRDYHHHLPGGFILDLIRSAIKRGAMHVALRVEPNRLELEDDAPPMEKLLPERIHDLTRDDLSDGSREGIIQDLMDPPGLGLISLFANQPETIEFHIRKNEAEGNRYTLKPGRDINIASSRLLPGSNQNRIVITTSQQNLLSHLPAVRSASTSAQATLSINDLPVKRGSVLRNVFFPRRFRLPPFSGSIEIALPESGETCRLVLTDRGIPWEELSLPPQGGFIFDLQVETPLPPGDNFSEQWIPVARQLYTIAAKEFPRQSQKHRQRMEALFFLYHGITGNTTVFEQVPLFQSSLKNHSFSFAQLKKKSAVAPLPFRFVHQKNSFSPPDAEPFLRLSIRQVDLLTRAGIPMRQIFDPIPGRPPAFLRQRRSIRRMQAVVSRILYSGKRQVKSPELSPREQRFFEFLTHRMPPPSDPSGIDSVTAWSLLILDCRGLLPVWPGSRLARFHLRDLAIARLHPDIQRAVNLYEKNPDSGEMIVSMFRTMSNL